MSTDHATSSRANRVRYRSPRRALALAVACGVALGAFAVPGIGVGPAAPTLHAQESAQSPTTHTFQTNPANLPSAPITGLPEGVKVNRIEWITPHHIAIFIQSAAMPDKEMQVQMLLARDWYANPSLEFPELWALDGLRARDDVSGWITDTNIAQQYADRNVNVILPIGGFGSFYTDWEQPDPKHGVQYKWESFLIDELAPILDQGFRGNGTRGVMGLSMGATGAMNLAQRHPDMFNFVGAFSGYLDTTTPGMPGAIKAAMEEADGWSAEAMWGPITEPPGETWKAHDPKLGVGQLKGKTIYISAGTGRDDFGMAGSLAKAPANAAGKGLEIVSRLSSQTFLEYAEDAGVDVIAKFRPSGVHTWDYWQFEVTEAWPHIADALKLAPTDRAVECAPQDDAAKAAEDAGLGACITGAYSVADGSMQEFRQGRVYSSPDRGTHALIGAIDTVYTAAGGPVGRLGFPVSGELPLPDGVGRVANFEHGSIVWHPDTGAHIVASNLIDYWMKNGIETGPLGYPTAGVEELDAPGTAVQQFQHGAIFTRPDGSFAVVPAGPIADKYAELGGPASPLGFPTSAKKAIKGGEVQEFEHGNIYFSEETGAHSIAYGDVFDHWGAAGFEEGPWGLPTSDLSPIPAGGLTIDFQGGTLSQVNGVIKEEKR
ncbi:alpha/beta hydrolase-fold protein [Corynebacterium uterequi]|uniref:Putative esterase n=1 Tax=Corynebacterium uterequi TaxID=1072256 RepID=A0A0G3HLN8_9CORY|nr:alpha/beta hydrolase-fold protein [Corynebacterium uterequi]AKK12047.1 putative esterase [Corynebacterium uterequi]